MPTKIVTWGISMVVTLMLSATAMVGTFYAMRADLYNIKESVAKIEVIVSDELATQRGMYLALTEKVAILGAEKKELERRLSKLEDRP